MFLCHTIARQNMFHIADVSTHLESLVISSLVCFSFEDWGFLGFDVA